MERTVQYIKALRREIRSADRSPDTLGIFIRRKFPIARVAIARYDKNDPVFGCEVSHTTYTAIVFENFHFSCCTHLHKNTILSAQVKILYNKNISLGPPEVSEIP